VAPDFFQQKSFRHQIFLNIQFVFLNHDEVLIRFSPEIMPYLINLKTNFTQHALSEISELNSKYAVILYRWLSMNYYQYEYYSVKGGRREEQIGMKELREMTDTAILSGLRKMFIHSTTN